MKYILQVLGAILYSPIVAVLLILIAVFPLIWVFEANWFWLIILFLFWGVVQLVSTFLYMVLVYPYQGLVKYNTVALVISIIILAGIGIYYLIKLWGNFTGQGFGMILLALIATGAVLRNIIFGIGGIIAAKDGFR